MISYVVLRIVGAALLALVGWQIGTAVSAGLGTAAFLPWGLTGVVAGAVLGGAFTPYVTLTPTRRIRERIETLSASRILAGLTGLLIGLLIAVLISVPVARIEGWLGVWIPVTLSVLLGLTGVVIMLIREQDLSRFLPQGELSLKADERSPGQTVVDTSAIIDGRIADISQTGFVNATMVIPRFVLDELRHIADSSDSLRRNRGRRGLEMLNKLRKEATVPVQVLDVDQWDGMEVDSKLVNLAKSLGASIITTDYNLNRVAEIQGIRVLNVNDLSNALKAVVLPGEDIQVRVIQEGKEVGQGVGFLDDGTMVVVENGRRFMDTITDVTVTRVLQTAAGRLIFAQIKVR